MKIKDITERYGLADEPGQNVSRASIRKTDATAVNQTKRAVNQQKNANDEFTISQSNSIRDQNRDQRRIPTGIPSRLMQPQPQSQSPQGLNQ